MKKRYTFFYKNWRSFGFSAILAVLFSLNSNAQTAPAKQWDKTFGGNEHEVFGSLKQTSDGGYILGGTSESSISATKSQPSLGQTDYWVLKLDANGNKLWDKVIGGSNKDELWSVFQTADGGYFVAGTSYSGVGTFKSDPVKGSNDYWVLKLDANGNKVWDKTFGGFGADELKYAEQTADGGFILGGSSNAPVGGDKSEPSRGMDDFWIVKLDASGNKQWDKTYGGAEMDRLYLAKQNPDGSYIIGGYSFLTATAPSGDRTATSKGGGDYWILKLDATGNKIWDKAFGTAGNDHLRGLQQTSDGGYILGGRANGPISGDKSEPARGISAYYDFWVVKIDATGNKQWDKTLGGDGEDHLEWLQQTTDGGYILGGRSESNNNGERTQPKKGPIDFWVVKLDAAGVKTWDLAPGGLGADVCYGVQQTADGGYILGGTSNSAVGGDKTQPSDGGTNDLWVVKLVGNQLGINNLINDLTVSVHPNPSQGKFNLKLNKLSVPSVQVIISDLFGRVVLQKELSVNGNAVYEELEIGNANGMYLLQIKAGDKSISRKIVVE